MVTHVYVSFSTRGRRSPTPPTFEHRFFQMQCLSASTLFLPGVPVQQQYICRYVHTAVCTVIELSKSVQGVWYLCYMRHNIFTRVCTGIQRTQQTARLMHWLISSPLHLSCHQEVRPSSGTTASSSDSNGGGRQQRQLPPGSPDGNDRQRRRIQQHQWPWRT